MGWWQEANLMRHYLEWVSTDRHWPLHILGKLSAKKDFTMKAQDYTVSILHKTFNRLYFDRGCKELNTRETEVFSNEDSRLLPNGDGCAIRIGSNVGRSDAQV